ncbi:MAG: hypothetical protein EA397_01425 [Deltaproteobacteria bacterium]|nr:MAG: hypothetical protein EA397_01425 [Deltaproteobacteria bacterium]
MYQGLTLVMLRLPPSRVVLMRPPLVHRLAFVIVPLVLIGAVSLAVVFGEKGVLRQHELRSELREANERLQRIELRNQRLLREIHAIEQDRVVVERVVAEELGWAAAGTTLYHFNDTARPEAK